MFPERGRSFSAGILIVAMSLASSAHAQDAPEGAVRYEEKLQELERQLSDLRMLVDEVDRVRVELDYAESDSIELDEIEPAGYVKFPEPEFVDWSARSPAAAPSSTIQYPMFKWSGFLQLDSGWIDQDDLNVITVGDIDAQVGLRRVRLRAFGDVRPNTHYVVDLDFAAAGHPSFRDVFIGLRNVPLVQNAAFGHYKTPFGMDAESSGQELLFLERQSPFAFAPFRQTGSGVSGTNHNETFTYSAMIFSFPTDSFGVGIGDGFSTSARLTALPYLNEAAGRLVHAI